MDRRHHHRLFLQSVFYKKFNQTITGYNHGLSEFEMLL
jgi:hypothetical protein